MEAFYEKAIRETVRDATGGLFRKYNGIDTPVETSPGVGATH